MRGLRPQPRLAALAAIQAAVPPLTQPQSAARVEEET